MVIVVYLVSPKVTLCYVKAKSFIIVIIIIVISSSKFCILAIFRQGEHFPTG